MVALEQVRTDMVEMDDKEIMQIMINSLKKAYQAAWENVVRTGTALVVMRKGKLIEFKPRYTFLYLLNLRGRKRPRKKNGLKRLDRHFCHKNYHVFVTFKIFLLQNSQKHTTFCEK